MPRPSNEHVVLVGLMGSGKTTVGRQVARRLDRPFIDSDAEVEAATGKTVREIFEDVGEAAFRRVETDVLVRALDSRPPAVIAAAGGVVLDPTNRRLLRERATVVWLRGRPETLARRVTRGAHRPLLDGDPAAALARMHADREHLYEEVADHVVDIDGCERDDVVAAVMDEVQ